MKKKKITLNKELDNVYGDLTRAMQASEIVGRGKKTKPKGKIVKVESVGDWLPSLYGKKQ